MNDTNSQDSPPPVLFSVFVTSDFKKPFIMVPPGSQGGFTANFTSFFVNIVILLIVCSMTSSSGMLFGYLIKK